MQNDDIKLDIDCSITKIEQTRNIVHLYNTDGSIRDSYPEGNYTTTLDFNINGFHLYKKTINKQVLNDLVPLLQSDQPKLNLKLLSIFTLKETNQYGAYFRAYNDYYFEILIEESEYYKLKEVKFANLKQNETKVKESLSDFAVLMGVCFASSLLSSAFSINNKPNQKVIKENNKQRIISLEEKKQDEKGEQNEPIIKSAVNKCE